VTLVGPAVTEESIVEGTPDEATHPLLEWDDRLSVPSQLVATSLTLATAIQQGDVQESEKRYEVQVPSPEAPVLHLTATASTGHEAVRFMWVIIHRVQQQLLEGQRDVSASPDLLIRAEVVTPPESPKRIWTTAIRSTAVILAGGITTAITLAFMSESLARYRRRLRGAASRTSEELDATWAPWPPGTGHRASAAKVLSHVQLSHRDVVTLLTAYVGVLILLPARLVIAGISYDITPAVAFGLLALLWWWNARLVAGHGVAGGTQPVRTAILLFGVALGVSHVAAMTRPLPAEELRSSDRLFVIMLAWFGIALLAADGIHSRARLDALLQRLVTAGTAFAGIGIMQFFTGIDIAGFFQIPGLAPIGELLIFVGERATFRRVAATALHPIEFGVVLAMLLPIALHYALHANARKMRKWGKVITISVGIPLSVSRSSILGVLTCALVMLPTWSWRRIRMMLIALLLFLAALQALVPGLIGALLSLFLDIEHDPSYQGRTQDYSVVGEFIRRSPLLGRGFGTFLATKYVLLDNQYLGAMIEIGAVGLVALLLLFLVPLFAARGARRRSQDLATRDLAQSLAAAVLCVSVSFATFDGFSFPMVSGLAFLLFGCCGALWRLCHQQLLNSPPDTQHALASSGNSTGMRG